MGPADVAATWRSRSWLGATYTRIAHFGCCNTTLVRSATSSRLTCTLSRIGSCSRYFYWTRFAEPGRFMPSGPGCHPACAAWALDQDRPGPGRKPDTVGWPVLIFGPRPPRALLPRPRPRARPRPPRAPASVRLVHGLFLCPRPLPLAAFICRCMPSSSCLLT